MARFLLPSLHPPFGCPVSAQPECGGTVRSVIDMTKLARRAFLGQLGACATGAIAGGLALSEAAHAAKPFAASGLRGSLDATQFGVRPDAFDDQSRLLQKVLDKAAREDRPVFLPPGVYIVSN
ncbi:MAG: hypothetical protein AAFO58_11045, partial [Pseudomonadota bacterium]